MEGLLLFVLVVLFFWVTMAFVVAGHAKDNGKTRYWGAAVFFFGIFGLMGYIFSLAAE